MIIFCNILINNLQVQLKMGNMGTPLKQMRLLLSPKLLSPLSPILQRPISNARNITHIAKKLDFSKSPCRNIRENNVKINVINCDSSKHGLNIIPGITKQYAENAKLQFKFLESVVAKNEDVQFLNGIIDSEHVGNRGNNTLLVNTPNKLDILKYGLLGKDYNVLGRGTFGTVVRGLYKGQDVAVKVVKTKLKLNELNALKLKHKNIIQVKDIIMKNENHSIIIMEFLKNSTDLQTVLNNCNFELSWQKIIQFSIDICEGLMYCHDNKILHLDLKPINILVCEDGSCKICDFGSSYKLEEFGSDYVYEGTVAYTAPEILIGNKPSFASDVYSLAIIFWQLRYRENPYSTLLNKDAVIYKVVKYGLRPTLTDSAEILDDFCSLYKSCWSEYESERPCLTSIIMKLRELL